MLWLVCVTTAVVGVCNSCAVVGVATVLWLVCVTSVLWLVCNSCAVVGVCNKCAVVMCVQGSAKETPCVRPSLRCWGKFPCRRKGTAPNPSLLLV